MFCLIELIFSGSNIQRLPKSKAVLLINQVSKPWRKSPKHLTFQ